MARTTIFGPYFATMLLTLLVWVYKSARIICARRFLRGGLAVHEVAVALVEVPGSTTTDVLPNGDEYRVVCGAGSERVFVAFVLGFAMLF